MKALLQRNPEVLHLGLMLTLTFSTGIVDAVGYLGLDRVFTGNMTGNVVILAMGLTGANGLPIVGPVIALAFFMSGAAIAGRTLRNQPAGWSHRSTRLFIVIGGVLSAAAGIAIAIAAPRGVIVNYSITAALGLAMGMQGGTARQIAVKDVTTVVVTSTIVGLAFDSRLGGGTGRQHWRRRGMAIVLIGSGAATGALLLRVHIGAGMLLAAVLSLVVAALGHIGRPQPDLD